MEKNMIKFNEVKELVVENLIDYMEFEESQVQHIKNAHSMSDLLCELDMLIGEGREFVLDCIVDYQ
jgi:hypothetical protein